MESVWVSKGILTNLFLKATGKKYFCGIAFKAAVNIMAEGK